MIRIAKIFAGLAGVIHVLFFLMESILWMNPSVHSVFLVESIANAEILDVYVKNQGYYNLYLALGMFAGLFIISRNSVAGRTLIGYISLVMIGAAIALLLTIPQMLTGVFIQGVPPLIALVALVASRSNTAT